MGEITFLGTGTSQGVPVISCNCEVCRSSDTHDKRLRSSALIEIGGKTIVIDCGPDFRQQMLREDVRSIDGILLTHNHKDHTAGIDDVRAFNYTSGEYVDIYAEERVQDTVKTEFSYAFGDNKYPGAPDINLLTIGEEPFRIGDVEILPVRGHHYKLPVLGFRIGGLCYITDMNRIEDSELEKLKDLDVLVINALRIGKHLSHFCFEEAMDIVARIRPKRAFFTHMSHQIGLHARIEGLTCSPDIKFAYDGLKVKFDDGK